MLYINDPEPNVKEERKMVFIIRRKSRREILFVMEETFYPKYGIFAYACNFEILHIPH